MNENKQVASCKCGASLKQTSTFPIWVYCETPSCDYVQIVGDYWIDSMLGRFSENKFAKEGPFKGRYEGVPFGLTIKDIKPMFIVGEIESV
ncbi:MAG: hypothetical protein ACI35R_10485 [Bacillus sp. (in: firmicutes)]